MKYSIKKLAEHDSELMVKLNKYCYTDTMYAF